MSCRGSQSKGRLGPRHVAGFGLLEAIVALTILASSGLALFAWVNQNLQTAARLKANEQRARLQLSALALLETVNPGLQAQGRIEQGGLQLEWTSSLVEPVRANATFSPPETGPWRVGLYRLQVKAHEPAQGVELVFTQLKVGTSRQAISEATP